MSSYNNNKLFIFTVLFPAFILPFVLSSPVPNSPYIIFINFLSREKCTMPKELKLPFPESSDPSPFSYLSIPLNECQTSDALKDYDEASMLCTEIFDVLKNITCVRYNKSLPVIDSDHLSENVCHDFGSLKDLLPKKENYLSGRLSDSLICKVLCSAEKYEQLCKTLLWSYDTLMKIKNALHSEEQVQKTGNETIHENSLEKTVTSVKPSSISDISEVKIKEHDKPKIAEDLNPEVENLVGSNQNQTDQEPLNPKISANVGDSSSQDILTKKVTSDVQIQGETVNKTTTTTTKNITSIIPQNKSEPKAKKLSPEDPESSIALIDSKNISSLNSHSESIDENENKINVDEKHPIKEIIDNNPEANVDKNSVTSNENEIKDDKNITSDNLPSNENDNIGAKQVKDNSNIGAKQVKDNSNIGAKQVKDNSNVGSKTSEKSAEPVVPATENDNELNSNFPEEGDKSKIKQTDVKNQEGKEIEKNRQTDYEGPNEVFPNSESKLPEPSTQSVPPDEDVEHQEEKDTNQYDDVESEGEYPKSEYDNSFNLPSKNKESEVKSSITTGSNQMTNVYGSNLNSKDNIGRISEEIAMIAPFPEQEDSHFFFYFLSIVLIIMAGYLLFHNKQKIIALIVEGRHERRRRSYGAGYKKLETK